MFKFLLIFYRKTLLKIVNHINYYNNFNYCTWIRAYPFKKAFITSIIIFFIFWLFLYLLRNQV